MIKPNSPGHAGRGRRRGVALIVALGVLVVLALLGTVFATMTGIERTVARNYIDKVRARLLAESGIEHAVSQLSKPEGVDIWTNPNTTLSKLPAWVYLGEDLNNNGVLDAGEDLNGNGRLDASSLPVSLARRPSFVCDRNKDSVIDGLDQITVDGKTVWVTGIPDVSTYEAERDHYAVRVVDLNSRINVNDQHANLPTILDNLATRIGLAAGTGTSIVNGRSPVTMGSTTVNVYRTLGEIATVIGQTNFDRIKPYITIYAWQDTKTVKPVTLAKRRGSVARGASLKRWVPGTAVSDSACAVYALRELRPNDAFDPAPTGTSTSGFRAEYRSPININNASKEVLAAILQGVKGYYIKEEPYGTTIYDTEEVRFTYSGFVPRDSGAVGIIHETPAIDAATADALAQLIVANRAKDPYGTGAQVTDGPFRSMQQVKDWIHQLSNANFGTLYTGVKTDIDASYGALNHGGVNDPAVEQASRDWFARRVCEDLLLANFNPNVTLNELNPDETVQTLVDKTDLSYHTYEVCFAPMGCFEVQSVGRVTDKSANTVAEEVLSTEVKVFDVYRDSTQQQFMREWIAGSRALNQVFSANASFVKTPDAVSLASYPEPTVATFADKASWGGYLALNSVQARATSALKPNLRARYYPTSGFNGVSSGGATVTVMPDRWNGVNCGPNYDAAVGGAVPGDMMVDGLLCEQKSSPGYPSTYFNQNQGTVSLWVKPSFHPQNSGKPRQFWGVTGYLVGWGLYSGTWSPAAGNWPNSPFCIRYNPNHNYAENQAIFYSFSNTSYRPRSIVGGMGGCTCCLELTGGAATGCLNHIGHSGHTAYDGFATILAAGRWCHIVYTWNDDLTENDSPGFANTYINGIPLTTRTWRLLFPYTIDSGCGSRARANKCWRWGGPSIGGPNTTDPPVRLGMETWGPKPTGPNGPWPSNVAWPLAHFPADATLDEFLIYTSMQDGEVLKVWTDEGRFYREPDATYTSPAIDFWASAQATRKWQLPPQGTAPVPPTAGGTGTITIPPIATPAVKLVYVSYTGWRPKDYITSPALEQLPACQFTFDITDSATGASLFSGGARPYASGGGGLTITPPTNPPTGDAIVPSAPIRYKVAIQSGAGLNTPLFATPILDDVTIAYMKGAPQFLSWASE